MPGYLGDNKVFSKKQGKFVAVEREQKFDYDSINQDSWSLLISFWRFYPDYFADMFRSDNATYKLQLPQRIMMRLFARYKDVYVTGCRGLTKTYTIILSKMIEGLLYSGERMVYIAPSQKQAAMLATQAFAQIQNDYPVIASYWKVKNDRQDMFRITTEKGSIFTMYSQRGDNSSQTIAEEMGQEGGDGFDMDSYETDIYPTCRIERQINNVVDRTHINQKHAHISNACSKQNKAYTTHRHRCLKSMVAGEKYEGYVMDISWEIALLTNLRNLAYIKDQKASLDRKAWEREMCARYTGQSDSSLISDEDLAGAKILPIAELKHCGDINSIYVVSYDVAYEDSTHNAKIGLAVIKLTQYEDDQKRDKYRKQVVYIDSFPPLPTARAQAENLKLIWQKYCLNEDSLAYLVVDSNGYGRNVIEELMKPTNDGTKPFSCINGKHPELEQPNAIRMLYPMISMRGGENPEHEMIKYAQLEFYQKHIELLLPDVLEGVERYKMAHRITDTSIDSKIALPYKKTEELSQQIENLVAKMGGTNLKEERRSKAIQRDMWSALKYGLWFSHLLEQEGLAEKYRYQSEWQKIAKEVINGKRTERQRQSNMRNELLKLRRR